MTNEVKNMNTYYKVLSKDNTAKDGGDFDYAPYLPKQEKDGSWTPGKWLPKRKTVLCESGWHVTQYWNIWLRTPQENIYEVECKGVMREDGVVGVKEKICCEQIRLLKPIHFVFDEKNNTGSGNTGNCNTGDWNAGSGNAGNRNTGVWNTGNWNAGNCNTGNCNTGNRNDGDWNNGNRNAGDWNTGDGNTGNGNTGDWNAGNKNTGNCNTGGWNTGNRNDGNRNTGNRNAGSWNTGNWNTGDFHSGWFNTKEHEAPKLLFGKPYVGKDPNFPLWLHVNEMTKECWVESFKKAPVEQLIATIKLPNFDYRVFKEITGITKKMFDERLKND